ncbi:MAG: D-alanine--D-alanine ligase, partial [Planococcus sp. (in: firmicutes)]|nr:D-alanine--D-alanine ligase [Planococcus sp. (in: firmicutes)]
MKKRIGLLYGGKSAEHEVSLTTASAFSKALDFDKYEVYPIYITQEGEWRKGTPLVGAVSSIEELQLAGDVERNNDISSFLPNDQEQALDVIIPLLHGPNGEDGTVQGLLEVMNLPYVGNGVLASSAGMDKVVMKQLFEQAGLNQTPYVYFLRRDWKNGQELWLDKGERGWTGGGVVRPGGLGSSGGGALAAAREE